MIGLMYEGRGAKHLKDIVLSRTTEWSTFDSFSRTAVQIQTKTATLHYYKKLVFIDVLITKTKQPGHYRYPSLRDKYKTLYELKENDDVVPYKYSNEEITEGKTWRGKTVKQIYSSIHSNNKKSRWEDENYIFVIFDDDSCLKINRKYIASLKKKFK